MKFGQNMDLDDPKVDLEGQGHRSKVKVTRSKNVIWGLTGNVWGQGSHGLGSKVTWVKPSPKVMVLAGGLTSTSCCIFITLDCLGFCNTSPLKLTNRYHTPPLHPELALLLLWSLSWKPLMYVIDLYTTCSLYFLVESLSFSHYEDKTVKSWIWSSRSVLRLQRVVVIYKKRYSTCTSI